MKAIITGINGFVGAHLAEHLLANGDVVLGFVRGHADDVQLPASLRGAVTVHAWDLAVGSQPPEEVCRVAETFVPQVIYHLAAVSMPADCESDPALAEVINLGGTRAVMRLAASLTSCPRVVFISSAKVYALPADPMQRVDESAPLAPRNVYGRTKLAGEHVVAHAVAHWGVDAVVARAFQHIGPGQLPPMMLPSWCEQYRRPGNDPVRVYTRDAVLDVTDVRDVVGAYRLLARHGTTGGRYNVGSGIARRSGDVLDLLRHLADPARPVVETRPGIQYNVLADPRRLRDQTGWEPRIALDQTVADTWQWWCRGGPAASA